MTNDRIHLLQINCSSIAVGMSDLIRQTTSWLNKWIPAFPSRGRVTEIERVVVRDIAESMLTGPGRYFIRAAGISGALAVVFGAYGAHGELEYQCLT